MKSIRPLFWLPVSALSIFAFASQAPGCVPSGSAPAYDAGASATTSTVSFKPSLDVMTAPFEDTFDRPAGDAASAEIEPTAEADGGEAGVKGADGGSVERSNLGPNWTQIKTSAWRVEGGKLCVQNAHNHGVWLNKTLPVNARIEFDATPFTDEGDLKAEVWGDGVSYAHGTSYTDATSYLAILGGWKNSLQVLARLNEHGADRKEIKIDKDSDDPIQRPIQKGQTYHFKIERSDGKTVRWSVDGVDFFSWNDPSPLAGQGHDHFGFNEWEVKVCFDNVKITPL